MANKALKLRMKAAESMLVESAAVGAVGVKKEHATNAMHMPNDHELLEVPPAKAVLAHFPPGCHVLFTNTRVVPLIVSRGKVASVFVDLSPSGTRDYCYKILLENQQNPVIAREADLQWAPQCPVWMKPLQDTQGCEWKQALIVGSYQAMGANTTPLYSVQGLETGNGLFHGLEKSNIRYRCNATENGQQGAPPIKSESPNKNEAMPPSVATSSALVPFTSTSLGPPHNMKTPAPKKQDKDVSRVTSSPRKRPLLGEPTADTADQDFAMGRCIAEFRMPYWMKGSFLNDAFIEQVCRGTEACTECRAVVLESSLPKRSDKDASSPLTGQSIFVYGRDMQAVERACELVADLLKVYVPRRRHKRKLVAELEKGWTKINYEDTKSVGATETSSSLWHQSNGAFANKKAKLAHSPSSEEEGEIPTPAKQHVVESTSKTLFQKPRTVSEDNKENRCVEKPIEQDSSATDAPLSSDPQTLVPQSGVGNKNATEPAEELATEPVAEPAAELAMELVAEPVTVPPTELVAEPAAEPATELVAEPTAEPPTELVAEPTADPPTKLSAYSSTGLTCVVKPPALKRTFRVPQFANEHYVKDALIGENEKNRQIMLQETGCDIELKTPEAVVLPLAPMKVILTGHSEGDLDYAQRFAENRIVSTVPEDQRGRMLYYLAKDNAYGTCEGAARYQRSPFDLRTWSWMCVVELPYEFDALHGLFVDKGGSAMKAIVRKTGCSKIHLSDSLPKHTLIMSHKLEAVNAAIHAVHDRVLWVLRESKKRNKR